MSALCALVLVTLMREDPQPLPVVLAGQSGWNGFGYAQANHRAGGGIVAAGDGRWAGLLDRGRFAWTTDLKVWPNAFMFPDGSYAVPGDMALVMTRKGRLVAGFVDGKSLGAHKSWVNDAEGMPKDLASRTYTTTSDDKGKTWSPPRLIQNQYCGAIRSMVQAGDGSLLVATTGLVPSVSRCMQYIYRSTDEGDTWKLVATFDDKEARGDHDGYVEGSLAPLKGDGMLIVLRTCRGTLFQSKSGDNGKTWSAPVTTGIPASSSPGTLLRLRSGRLVLAYNPICPSGTAPEAIRKFTYPGSKRPSSWYRGEIYLRWSDDDAKTWSEPRLLLKHPQPDRTVGGSGIGYVQLVEPQPGVVWGNVFQGGEFVGANGQFKFEETDLK